MKDTGMFCDSPFIVNEFFHGALNADPDYSCPASEFPFEYKGWDPKWYSPLCRGWYKEQASKTD